ncbi:MAG TPA: SRPBCC domain-containing protein [Ferruginibacter sp.]|nr:SRPBCC domain-containing protein [Ferruginibacter sp.]
MITLNYSAHIVAPREKVWQVLWADETYRTWSSAFMEGSYAESYWEEGAEIKFLTPDKNGMFGIIEKMIPNTEMSFRHLGEIKDGIEVKKNWKDGTERYFLANKDAGTQLDIVLTMDDGNKEFAGYLNAAFPEALKMIKQLSEV